MDVMSKIVMLQTEREELLARNRELEARLLLAESRELNLINNIKCLLAGNERERHQGECI